MAKLMSMRPVPFTLEQIETFIAVVEAGSMTKAAQSLFITQGAVTQQVQHLEQALGVQLLERQSTGAALTEAGRVLFDACTLASRDLEAILEVAGHIRSLEVGSLRVGAGRTSASHYLPRYLADFCQRFPSVELEVTVAHASLLREMVMRASLDCAITSALDPARLHNPKLRIHVLGHEDLVTVVSRHHPLATMKRVSQDDLARHRRLVLEPGSAIGGVAMQLYHSTGSIPTAKFRDPEAARAAILEGLGFATLPEIAVHRDLINGDLVRLPLPSTSRSVVAMRRSDTRIPATEEFWAILTADGGSV